MRRAPLVLAGTVAGAVGVLAFPVHSPSLSITAADASGTGSSGASPAPSASASAAGTPAKPASGARSATGTDEQFRYGDLAVAVTVENGKITKVTVPTLNVTDGRSAAIDDYAVPELEQQAVSAGSADIDGVSGATFTSEAFAQSLASALGKLGMK